MLDSKIKTSRRDLVPHSFQVSLTFSKIQDYYVTLPSGDDPTLPSATNINDYMLHFFVNIPNQKNINLQDKLKVDNEFLKIDKAFLSQQAAGILDVISAE